MIDGQDELLQFLDRSTRLFETALLNLIKARYEGKGDPTRALADLARLLRHTMILSNLSARKRVLMEARGLKRGGAFTALPDRTPISFDVPFQQAVDDLVKREPVLASSAAEVSRLYSESKVFAMAKSISQKLTERVQASLAAVIKTGEGSRDPEKDILRIASEECHQWARSYAETVYETNVSTVYTEGRIEQAKDPDVAKVISALEVVGVKDARERPNHSFARGLIAAPNSTVWTARKAKPPYGYRCRHGLIFVSKYTLERKGLTEPDADGVYFYPPDFDKFEPDEGFGVGGL